MFRRIILLLLISLISLVGYTQKKELKGKVIDARSKKPLVFVNVVYGTPQHGTTTNIDGFFNLKVSSSTEKIHFSYLGYKKKTISLDSLENKQNIIIKLHKKPFSLKEVVVKPGYNPAHRIIRKAYQNKEKHNPENLESFSYKTYNKMIFTVDSTSLSDSISQPDTAKVDSVELRLRKFRNRQYIMLIESVSKREFLAPDNYHEKVLASRVSGFKDPSLFYLSTLYQPFSFYDQVIEIGDYNYLNPITKNSEKHYYFHLEDTLFSNRKDSTFVISFRPRKGKNFDAMKGILHINTNGYALERVIAEPYDPPKQFTIKIQQEYDYVNDQQWFPTHLNTQIEFHDILYENKQNEYFLLGDGRTYLKNIKLNPEVDPKKFSNVELKIPDSAYYKDTSFWENQRVMPLTEREKRTYRIIDSLGEAHNFDGMIKRFFAVATGYYPYKYINLDLAKIYTYNRHEGHRLGLGLLTNDDVSEYFSVGGYFGYGFKDKDWKYGGQLNLNLHKESETQLSFRYYDDVRETGGYEFMNKNDLSNNEMFRKFLIKDMVREETYETSLSFRTLKYLKLNLFARHSDIKPFNDYQYETNAKVIDNFIVSEVGLNLKYAYKEKFMETPYGRFSLGTDFPIFYGNIIRGVPWYNGKFSYTKFEAAMSESFFIKMVGTSHTKVVGGYASGEVPYFNLYNGHGGFGDKFSIYSDNSFSTMRLGEFYADRFVSLYYRHNFGSLLFKGEKFKPQISVLNNMAWGWLKNKQKHKNIDLNSYDKGYYEAGLLIDNIINLNFFSYGMGVFYRYGPYSLENESNNFAYKFSFRFQLEEQ